MAYIFVNVNRSVGTINPNIYGQFSEHLGRCIYQGIYVGQASDIPNTNGMRNDVVSALKALHVPVLRWPGGCFADTYDTRYVQSSGSTFSLLRTTVDEGKNLHAFSDIHYADSLWSVDLVAAGTQHINVHLIHIDRNMSKCLYCVRVE